MRNNNTPLTLRNRDQENFLFQSRLRATIIFIATLSIILIIRLLYLQIIQHPTYTTLAKQNEIALIPLPPKRGLIFDRNGVLLAKNIPVFNLVVTPENTLHLKKELSLLQHFIPLTPTELTLFKKQLKEHRRFDEVPLKLKLTQEEMATFEVNRFRFPGFNVEAGLLRRYPLGKATSDVVGYVSRINAQELSTIDLANYAGTNYIGKTGLEKYYETTLHGSVGYQQVETDASGRIVRAMQLIEPQSGVNLYLTIDSQLQMAAQKAMHGYQGTLVAIDPSTGQILAMVSEPTFNPNHFVKGISQKQYTALQNNPFRPLYNRAINGLYATGSTIKPFIGLEGLKTQTITADTTIFDPGWYKIPGTTHVFHDWLPTGHGIVNLHKAIMISCDTYFYNLAYHLGINPIDHVLHQFGFGRLTGIDFPNELKGTLPSPRYKMKVTGHPWYPGDTVNTIIGQGYMQATAVQLANAVATLSQRGVRHRPMLVYAIQPVGQPLTIQPTIKLSHVKIPENYWQIITGAMQDVIQQGTGVGFGRTPYIVAGKTGTAQVLSIDYKKGTYVPELNRSHSVFIAFAPVDNPQIAMAVIIEHHPDAAQRVARQVFDYYLLTEKHWTPIPKVTTSSTGISNGTQ